MQTSNRTGRKVTSTISNLYQQAATSIQPPPLKSIPATNNHAFPTHNHNYNHTQQPMHAAPIALAEPQLVVIKQNSLCEEKHPRGAKGTNQLAHSSVTVHVVVKNSPFIVSLGVALPYPSQLPDSFAKYTNGSGQFDLGKVTFDCQLLYDAPAGDGSENEVDYVSNKPYKFKVTTTDGGARADLEVRLTVLSSQHEDMFFRVKFLALDPQTKKEIGPSLITYSAPIKVISKPEQLKKRRPSKKRTLNDMLLEALQRLEAKQLEHQKVLQHFGVAVAQPAKRIRIKREAADSEEEEDDEEGYEGAEEEDAMDRSGRDGMGSDDGPGDQINSENILSHMQDISQHRSASPLATTVTGTHFIHQPQHQQHDHMHHYHHQHHNQQQHQHVHHQQQNQQPSITVENTPPIDFEQAVSNLVQKYSNLSPEERPAKIQRVLQTSTSFSRESLYELHDLFKSEGLQQAIGQEVPEGSYFLGRGKSGESEKEGEEHRDGGLLAELGAGRCQCIACPHRLELERIELFYKDVFHLSNG